MSTYSVCREYFLFISTAIYYDPISLVKLVVTCRLFQSLPKSTYRKKLVFMVMKLKRINERSLNFSTCTQANQLVISVMNAKQIKINSSNIFLAITQIINRPISPTVPM